MVWHPQEESRPTLLTRGISGRFDTVHSRVVGHPAVVCFPGGNKMGDQAETLERLAGRERGGCALIPGCGESSPHGAVSTRDPVYSMTTEGPVSTSV